MRWLSSLLLLTLTACCFLLGSVASAIASPLKIGSAVRDITGPAAERLMMGYANPFQFSRGIHTRLFSRAFVIEKPDTGKRVALVVVDLGMVFEPVYTAVAQRLQLSLPGRYSRENIMILATHTHSGPGGFSHHDLFNLSSLGFDAKNFETIVQGIHDSILEADQRLEPGHLSWGQGELRGASWNRSRPAYQNNPDRGLYETDVDLTNGLLKFTTDGGEDIGALNWFAVHATSMGKWNLLISGDNKGHAAYLLENEMRLKRSPRFVGGFANSNAGDSSPNPIGVFLSDRDKTEHNGFLQYGKARDLLDHAVPLEVLALDFRQVWVNMPSLQLPSGNRLCKPALGFSFAAGAEDGPSDIPGIHEGMRQGDAVPPILHEPLVWFARFALGATDEGSECHYPKLILISKGPQNPDLIAETVPVQLFQIGPIAIAGVPAEITTMAGRRLRQFLQEKLAPLGVHQVVVGGLANDYTNYVTTPEEYSLQHYEGGSTLFGPNTLEGYLEVFGRLAESLIQGTHISIDLPPVPRSKPLFDIQPPVVFDDKRFWENWGEVLVKPLPRYVQGSTVVASFRSGHPKNNYFTGSSFFEIQKLENDTWVPVAGDNEPETDFYWVREKSPDCLACSSIHVVWRVPIHQPVGTYRIFHRGSRKALAKQSPIPLTGVTEPFTLSSRTSL